MQKVLLIDNYDSFTYNLAQLLYESKMCDFTVIKNDAVKIAEISLFDKILISPGPGLPKDSGKIIQVIDTWHKNKSILGICLGMQAVAEYFGSKLYNMKNVYHGIKIQTSIKDKNEILFEGLPENIDTGLYHSWAVYSDLSKNLKITAVSKDNIIMGISHTKYDVKGIQFHPESYMTKFGKNIIENWLKTYPEKSPIITANY
jgi:anthranilate synthase component II